MFAEIILARTASYTDKIYHYKIPEDLKNKLKIGMQVLIPFGKRKDVGYVVGLIEKTEVKGLKDILQILSPYPLFSENSLKIAKWMAEYYNSFLITALRTVMPPGTIDKEKRALKTNLKKPLYNKIQMTNDKIQMKSKIQMTKDKQFELTREQKEAVSLIEKDFNEEKTDTILLYGVTGSGKTEVYLRAIEKVLGKGKSAIILVPEIGLTPLIVERFHERFKDGLALYHSEMTIKERTDKWNRIASGQARVVLGSRSAVFTPIQDLGLIVMDEEYENSYKQDMSPKYNTYDVAKKLAELNNALIVLGTATPSVETFYKAKTGKFKIVSLPKRIDNRPLPPVEVIDMRKEIKSGNRGILSSKLKKEVKNVLDNKKQAILFMNRRGYFNFVMCRECGETIKCPNCHVSIGFDQNEKKNKCVKCGYRTSATLICPNCQSSSVKYFGAGTQRIEKEIADVFPFARVIRIDRDTVSKKGAYEKAIKVFAEGKADILIGTQIVTKGLDLESVTLVAAVAADIALNLPDFRAPEHTFQLLTQVAGRAGRHFLPGRVIIQTYHPDHYVIKAAADHNYEEFYNEEIKNREELGYPPFSKLIGIELSNPEESKVKKLSDDYKKLLDKRVDGFQILGPSKAFISKLRGQYRYKIILKGKDMEAMRRAAVESLSKVVKLGRSRISLDVDPLNLL